MNRTRWKLMIGAFGLGAAGLAAVAAGPGTSPPPPALPATKALEPLAVPSLPTPPPGVIPAGGTGPALPALPPADAKPTVPPAGTGVVLPPAATPPKPTPEPTAAPKFDFNPPAAPLPPAGVPDAKPVTGHKLEGGAVIPDGPTLPLLPGVAPAPGAFTEPPKPASDRIPATSVGEAPRPAAPVLSEPVPSARPTPAANIPPQPAPEKKLAVMLHMGDERPKFEIKDASEVYLKVTSDRVDVQSPKDGRANQSSMRATGKVVFVTPGGEGTCDELAVVPGTGQVTVTGNVAFTYNWGKVETTVTGEKMTFRLGGTPGATDKLATTR